MCILVMSALALGLSPVVVYAADPKTNARLCGVKESGFTYFPQTEKYPAGVSYGWVVRNATRRTAVQTGVIVNFYDASGKLIQTEGQLYSVEYLSPRESVATGNQVVADGAIASMKVFMVCAPQSVSGAASQDPPFLRHLSFNGSVTANVTTTMSYGRAKLAGSFKNTGKNVMYSGLATFVLRNADGRIVGGGYLNGELFSKVAAGVEVLWDSEIEGNYPVGTSVEASVGNDPWILNH